MHFVTFCLQQQTTFLSKFLSALKSPGLRPTRILQKSRWWRLTGRNSDVRHFLFKWSASNSNSFKTALPCTWVLL